MIGTGATVSMRNTRRVHETARFIRSLLALETIA
jgi:hypothetical protein